MRKKPTTTISTEGQVILPKAIRQSRAWAPGTRLTVEETPDGILLKPAPAFAETQSQDVFGKLASKGQPKSIGEMDAAVLAKARRRYAGDCANLIVRYLTGDHPEQNARA